MPRQLSWRGFCLMGRSPRYGNCFTVLIQPLCPMVAFVAHRRTRRSSAHLRLSIPLPSSCILCPVIQSHVGRRFLMFLRMVATVFCTLCLAALSGCSQTGGGENGPVAHYEYVRIISVDRKSQSANVCILEWPDDMDIAQSALAAGAEGMADFEGMMPTELPAAGEDVILYWIGTPSEESSFPIDVYRWNTVENFIAGMEEGWEQPSAS